MGLQIVYRGLRKISDWVLDGYYSEILVEGHASVPKHGPLIIASTHPNEIIDIATLAATIPHRQSRFLCFWAKSGLFKNPFANAILRSSGAIPVKRNLNKTSSEDLSAREALFSETTEVLRSGGVVGVFPEGGSYTGWRVLQVMPGAAWCGVEYTVKSTINDEPAVIVPTAITYTDKSGYGSRVHVRYGEPVRMRTHLDELVDTGLDHDRQVAANRVAKEVTTTLETRLQAMTVNAPDWETICAIKAARQILFVDEDRVDLSCWIQLEQWFADTLNQGKAAETKDALVKYHSLLYHTSIHHSTLESLIPTSSARATSAQALISWSKSLPLAIIRFAAFIPPLILYLPGYIAASITASVLAKANEEEAHAQFRAVGGGLGIGAHVAGWLIFLWTSSYEAKRVVFGQGFLGTKWTQIGHGLAVAYFSVRILSRWHKLLFKENEKERQKILTCMKIIRGLHVHTDLHPSEVEPYTKPVYPPIPRFIKADVYRPPHRELPRIDRVKLFPALLEARKLAASLVHQHIAQMKPTLPENLANLL